MSSMSLVSQHGGARVWRDPFEDKSKTIMIRWQICKHLSDLQYNFFAGVCKDKQLDPTLDQAMPILIDEGTDAESVRVLVKIGGLRVIAARTGRYMAGPETRYFRNKKLADKDKALSINPGGIVRATAYVKAYLQGEWHTVSATAKWDEYAPFKEIYSDFGDRLGAQFIDRDSFWYRMPEFMLEKCATALALRKAFPDEFAGVWEAGEFDKSRTNPAIRDTQGRVVTLSPSEFVRHVETERRLAGIGGAAIPMIFDQDIGPEMILVGQFMGRMEEFIAHHQDDLEAIIRMRDLNRDGLRMFWAHEKEKAFELREQINKIEDSLTGGRSFKDRAPTRRPPKMAETHARGSGGAPKPRTVVSSPYNEGDSGMERIY